MSVISTDDSIDALPVGWTKTTIGDVVEPKVSQDGPSETEQNFVYIDISAVDNAAKLINEPKPIPVRDAPSRARQKVRAGDVLISMTRPNLNAVAMVPEALDGTVASTGFNVLRAGKVDPRWLFMIVRSHAFIEEMSDKVQGALYPAVRPHDIRSYSIPLPPLVEQKRIVAKVEKVLARVNAARERLVKVPTILKRFRQSVVAAACSGRLTADWRESHRTEVTGRQLVDQVRDALRRGIADQVLIERTGGRLQRLGLLDDRSVDRSALPEAPDSWTWLYLPQAGYMNRGRSRNRPRGAAHLYGGPHPFVQTGDIARSNGRIVRHEQTYSDAGLEQSRLWPVGTICITIAANIANTAILTYPACFPDSVVGLVTEPKLLDNRFVEFFMRTARNDLAAYAPATAQKNINVEILSEVAVPVPPRAEQREIVTRVEKMFDLADKIEAKVMAGTMRAEKLVQATLAKAFRGELVPTEAELAEQEGREFETAEALLERIRQERGNECTVAAPRRRPRTATPTPPSNGKHRENLVDVDVPANGSGRSSGATNGSQASSDASDAQKRSQKPRDGSGNGWVEISYDDAMGYLRNAFAEGGARDREQAIKDVAVALGYQRVGSRVRETVDGYLRAAVRRGILVNENGQYSIRVRSAADYSRDHLIDRLVAAMNDGWVERDDAVRTTAKHLGFQRAGAAFVAAMKAAINGAIRRGLLEYEGEMIRKT